MDQARVGVELIEKILSFVPIKDAVSASSMCNETRHMWMTNPDLMFELDPNDLNTSFNEIQRTLLVRPRNLKLQKVELVCDELDRSLEDSFRLENVLIALDQFQVEEVIFDFGNVDLNAYADQMIWPLKMENVQVLRFRFEGRRMTLDKGAKLGRLKTLVLDTVTLDNQTLSRIISSSPVLEQLWIEACALDMDELRVDANKLITFSWINNEDYFNDNRLRLVLRAPNLRNFICSCGVLRSSNIQVSTYLDKVRLNVHVTRNANGMEYAREAQRGDGVAYLLESVHITESLALSASTIELLSSSRRLLDLPIFPNLKYVKVTLPSNTRSHHYRAQVFILTVPVIHVKTLELEVTTVKSYNLDDIQGPINGPNNIISSIHSIVFKNLKDLAEEKYLIKMILRMVQNIESVKLIASVNMLKRKRVTMLCKLIHSLSTMEVRNRNNLHVILEGEEIPTQRLVSTARNMHEDRNFNGKEILLTWDN